MYIVYNLFVTRLLHIYLVANAALSSSSSFLCSNKLSLDSCNSFSVSVTLFSMRSRSLWSLTDTYSSIGVSQ